MSMRRIARRGLCLLDLCLPGLCLSLSLAVPSLARADAPTPPPGPLSAAVMTALGARDGLVAEGDPELFRVGARWLTSQQAAELDGTPPREVIVEVTEYTGEGTWQTEFHAYRTPADDSTLPARMGDPIISGGYRDPGYLRVEDVIGDGIDALMVIGDTDGGSPSALEIWRWDGRGFVDWMWGPDPGLEYLPFAPPWAIDLPPGPGLAVVALRPSWGPEGATGGPIVEPWALIDGRFRPWPVDPTPWLGPLVADVAEAAPIARPDHLWPMLADAMRSAGVRPPDPEPTQRRLEALHGALDATEDHAALLTLMAWKGNAAARPHLRRLIELPHQPSIRAAAAEALARVGDEADRAALLDMLAPDAIGAAPEWVVGAIVRGMSAEGDPRARARVAAALTDRALPVDVRRGLVRPLGTDTAAVPDMARALAALEPALRAAVVEGLWSRALSDPEHPAWRVPDVAAAIRPLLADADPAVAPAAVRALAVEVLAVADDRAAQTFREALPTASTGLRLRLLQALAERAPDDIEPGRRLARAAAERLASAGGVAAADADDLHRLIARYGDDGALAVGLAHATAVSQIDDYAGALATHPPGMPSRDAIVEALLRFTTPDRPDRIRQAAARALGPVDDDRARAALTLLMRSDPVFYVRSDAAEALGRRHPEVEAALIVALVGEAEAHVRGDMIEALGHHGSPRARATLIDRLDHPADGWAAAHALARVPDAAGLEVGAVLARHAASRVARPGGCEQVTTPLGALARAGLAEARAALDDAITACPDHRAALVLHVIDGWQREGSPTSLGDIARFADDPDRAISRAVWGALARAPE